MSYKDQSRAPIMEALLAHRKNRVVPFDVPGHKSGRGNKELTRFLGEDCMSMDVNSMKNLDNLCHPVSVIKDAEELAAEAFGAAYAFFMVGGTTSSVQAMIMATCKEGDKIILPRNVHKSAINALILSGAMPVYAAPATLDSIGIAGGFTVSEAKRMFDQHPDAKAIFINNPTYYGICSDLRSIVKLARERGIQVLVDEAHGTHLYFGEDLPVSAMEAGADMASVSMHKSGGSLTQSSFLLTGPAVNKDYVRQIINLTQTTSGSYLLLSSLDISRKKLATDGVEIFQKVSEMAEYAREEINSIGGYYAYGQELVDGQGVFAFDRTKLSVNTYDTGLTGIEVYDLLRDEYDIQIEFGDIGNFLAYISVGDRYKEIERLVSALHDIYRVYRRDKNAVVRHPVIAPIVTATPKEAFYALKKPVKLKDSAGWICSEFIMCYPPGIPILAPGERITQEAVDYILYAKEKGCVLTGTQDESVDHLYVLS